MSPAGLSPIAELSIRRFRPARLRDGREGIEILDQAGATISVVTADDPRFETLIRLAAATNPAAFGRGEPNTADITLALLAMVWMAVGKLAGVI